MDIKYYGQEGNIDKRIALNKAFSSWLVWSKQYVYDIQKFVMTNN